MNRGFRDLRVLETTACYTIQNSGRYEDDQGHQVQP
jgi:hypothetical protein